MRRFCNRAEICVWLGSSNVAETSRWRRRRIADPFMRLATDSFRRHSRTPTTHRSPHDYKISARLLPGSCGVLSSSARFLLVVLVLLQEQAAGEPNSDPVPWIIGRTQRYVSTPTLTGASRSHEVQGTHCAREPPFHGRPSSLSRRRAPRPYGSARGCFEMQAVPRARPGTRYSSRAPPQPRRRVEP